MLGSGRLGSSPRIVIITAVESCSPVPVFHCPEGSTCQHAHHTIMSESAPVECGQICAHHSCFLGRLYDFTGQAAGQCVTPGPVGYGVLQKAQCTAPVPALQQASASHLSALGTFALLSPRTVHTCTLLSHSEFPPENFLCHILWAVTPLS